MSLDEQRRNLLRELPSVDEVLGTESVRAAGARLGRGRIAHHVRALLRELRSHLLSGAPLQEEGSLRPDAIARKAIDRVATHGTPLPRVINATGVILHSGLGRAPLPSAAVAAIARAGTYSLLEVDREEGRRLARDTRAVELLRALTGAPAGLVVNNNAAATLLMLSALAPGGEVICSRGEMVEIGGSFRIPDVMLQSGCRLVEVGCTNRTHARDYEEAITESTRALLVVHTSNYRNQGFTAAPALDEVVAIGRRHELPVLHDLGSGSLLGPERLGLGDEPPVGASLKAGCTVVSMSGDKLLGGPQCGILLGEEEAIGRMRRHPLARALRIDKMTVAALEATLQLYLDEDRLTQTHPVFHMLTAPAEEIGERAARLARSLQETCGGDLRAEVVSLVSETGSGALPTLGIPSYGVALSCEGIPPDGLARRLRTGRVAVFARIVDDRVCLDARTLFDEDLDEIPALVAGALHRHAGADGERG